jgi:hypothetical protein
VRDAACRLEDHDLLARVGEPLWRP